MRTYYDILGVTPNAPAEIVSAVYRAWMRAMKIHPDLGGDGELARVINVAYDTLKDPVRRASYDTKVQSIISDLKKETRRRAARVQVSANIAFCIPPEGTWLPAEVVDASTLGLKLKTNEDLFDGLHVSIAFPSSPAPAAEAVVRWSKILKNDGAWRCEAGVEFFNPVPDILKRIGQSVGG